MLFGSICATIQPKIDPASRDAGVNDDFVPEVAPIVDARQLNPSTEAFRNGLKEHSQNFIDHQSEDPLLMEVRRTSVMTDALALIRCSQEDLHSPLKITFCGEDGVDLGGLRREFWSLMLHNVSSSNLVTGKPGRLTFQQNFMEKKKRTFFYLGQLTVLSILQDGLGLPIFSDIVTDYIIDGKHSSVNIDDLPEPLIDILKKMEDSATNEEKLRELYSTIMDNAFDIGFIVPITSFTRQHIKPLTAALVESQLVCKEELDQFIQGLETHQILSFLRLEENKAAARTLLSGRVKPLTVASLRSLLRFNYNEGNSAIAERATGQGFITFLQATKGSNTTINGIHIQPKDVLMWLTGSTNIPAIGFHKPIDVYFEEVTFVNTCALVLKLKIQPDMSPEDAIPFYTETIINSQTFTHD